MSSYSNTKSNVFFQQYENVESLSSVNLSSQSFLVKLWHMCIKRDNCIGNNGWSW